MPHDPNAAPADISQAAADWFIAMREPVVPESDRAAFVAWLQASPVHVRAYLELAHLWGDAAQLDALTTTAGALEMASDNVLPIHGAAPSPQSATTARRSSMPAPRPTAARRRLYAVAASVPLVAGLVGVFAWWQLPRPPAYVADVGEQRILTLEDGSIVRLNSRSGIKVTMGATQRLVELVDGQALFEVAKDARRPFIVRSDDMTARAVGTRFDVYRKASGTVVTVVEGEVEVRTAPVGGHAAADPSPPGVSVKAGGQVTVGRGGAVEHRIDANVDAATRWLTQELVFEGQSLNAVVEEFNRYQRVPIVLDDPVLGELRVNAAFNTTSPEPLLRFIGRLESVRVERTPRDIRISRQ